MINNIGIGHNNPPIIADILTKHEVMKATLLNDRLSQTKKLALMGLIMFSDDNFENAQPGSKTLQRCASVQKDRTVHLALKGLEVDRLVERQRRPIGYVSVYSVCAPRIMSIAAEIEEQLKEERRLARHKALVGAIMEGGKEGPGEGQLPPLKVPTLNGTTPSEGGYSGGRLPPLRVPTPKGVPPLKGGSQEIETTPSEGGYLGQTTPSEGGSFKEEEKEERKEKGFGRDAPDLSSKACAMVLIPEPTPEPTGGSTGASAQVREAHAAYNAVAVQLGLPVAKLLTPDRIRRIRSRLQEHGMAGWTEALANIGRSKFLTGRANTHFLANLDFVLQPKSFNKLIEGAYNDKGFIAPSATAAADTRALDAGLAERRRQEDEMQRELLAQSFSGGDA